MSEDIIFDILLWLPVASLLRFKMVCKSWFALIESSTFVNQHLHHHRGEDALIVSGTGARNLHFCLFSGNKYETYADIDFDDQICTTIKADGCLVNLVDSCDGIICLHNDRSEDVALWNPALKQLKLLPKSSISHQRYNNRGDIDVQLTTIGFGFDAKANDYKVVRIILHCATPDINQVEIYSLRTSSSWRIIHKNGALTFTDLYGYSYHATSKNGTCFWVGFDKHENFIVAFDLKNEVFETISLPDSHVFKPCYALDFLNEKLACIRGLDPYYRSNNCFEIWVLHEFGMKKSWNKIYNIGPTPYIGDGLHPTGFSRNGEFLLLRTTFMSHHIGELYLYSLGTQESTQEIYVPVQEPNPCYLRFFLHYNESLVSLKS